MDPLAIALAALAFACGGILKGAIGAGAPVIAVPILALLYDVPLAVALFTLPNLLSNSWQGWCSTSTITFDAAPVKLRWINLRLDRSAARHRR